MDGPVIDPATATASADQYLAATDWLARVWPHNEHLVEDERVSLAVVRALGGWDGESWEQVRPGGAYLLAPAVGRAIEIGPDDGNVAGIVATLTQPETMPCDRCDRMPRAAGGQPGWLLVASPPHLVAFSMCDVCAIEMSSEFRPVVWA
jgi:hypothetical protein